MKQAERVRSERARASIELMRAQRHASACAALALTFGVACGVGESQSDRQYFEEVPAQVTLLNLSHELQFVTIHELSLDLTLDCNLVATNPAAFLRAEHFTHARNEHLFAGQEVGLLKEHRSQTRPCQAALIKHDRMPDVVVFWDGSLDFKRFQRDPDIPKDVPPDPQTIVLHADYSASRASDVRPWREHGPCGRGVDLNCSVSNQAEAARAPAGARYFWTYRHSTELYFEVPSEPDSPVCESSPAALQWDEAPAGEWAVESISTTTPGCHIVRLASVFGQLTSTWQLCASHEVVAPLRPQQDMTVRLKFRPEVQLDTNRYYESLLIDVMRLDLEERVIPGGFVQLTRGNAIPQHLGVRWDAVMNEACSPPGGDCVDVPVSMSVRVGVESKIIHAGEHLTLDSGGVLHLVRGMQRAIVRNESSCQGPGDDQSGLYIETAITAN